MNTTKLGEAAADYGREYLANKNASVVGYEKLELAITGPNGADRSSDLLKKMQKLATGDSLEAEDMEYRAAYNCAVAQATTGEIPDKARQDYANGTSILRLSNAAKSKDESAPPKPLLEEDAEKLFEDASDSCYGKLEEAVKADLPDGIETVIIKFPVPVGMAAIAIKNLDSMS